MNRLTVAVAAVLAASALVIGASARQSGDSAYEPKRINKAIELLEAGQPVYYFQFPGGGYDEGKELAQTWADAIGYNVEQAPFSALQFKAFMQGLIDGGPTKSGHRTPAVIVAKNRGMGKDRLKDRMGAQRAQSLIEGPRGGVFFRLFIPLPATRHAASPRCAAGRERFRPAASPAGPRRPPDRKQPSGRFPD